MWQKQKRQTKPFQSEFGTKNTTVDNRLLSAGMCGRLRIELPPLLPLLPLLLLWVTHASLGLGFVHWAEQFWLDELVKRVFVHLAVHTFCLSVCVLQLPLLELIVALLAQVMVLTHTALEAKAADRRRAAAIARDRKMRAEVRIH